MTDLNEVQLSVDRIIDFARAVDIIGGVDDLPQKTEYWLGRLGDFTSSIVKTYNKNREKAQRVMAGKQKPLSDTYTKIEDKQSQEAINLLDKINEMNADFSQQIQDLLDVKETIKMPEFKLAEFAALEDTVRVHEVQEKNDKGETVTKKVEIKIKKGQSLVPVHFYKLMGEYIKE